MRKPPYSICAWAGAALLGFAGSTWAADVPAAAAHRSLSGFTLIVRG
jgi:hypothetical protein